jgi:hypothetical protein
MATSLSLENDSSLAQGYIKVNGSTAATLTTSGITANLTGNVTGNVTGSLTQGGSLTLATAQSASGTAVNFTSIPSWAKRITVMLSGVSTSGSSNIQIQLGNVTFVTSGYASSNTAGGNTVNTTSATTGHLLATSVGQTMLFNGHAVFTNISSNLWVGSSNILSTFNLSFSVGASNITLSSTLDRIRITTVNGTDTFDAGTINISYEG